MSKRPTFLVDHENFRLLYHHRYRAESPDHGSSFHSSFPCSEFGEEDLKLGDQLDILNGPVESAVRGLGIRWAACGHWPPSVVEYSAPGSSEVLCGTGGEGIHHPESPSGGSKLTVTVVSVTGEGTGGGSLAPASYRSITGAKVRIVRTLHKRSFAGEPMELEERISPDDVIVCDLSSRPVVLEGILHYIRLLERLRDVKIALETSYDEKTLQNCIDGLVTRQNLLPHVQPSIFLTRQLRSFSQNAQLAHNLRVNLSLPDRSGTCPSTAPMITHPRRSPRLYDAGLLQALEFFLDEIAVRGQYQAVLSAAHQGPPVSSDEFSPRMNSSTLQAPKWYARLVRDGMVAVVRRGGLSTAATINNRQTTADVLCSLRNLLGIARRCQHERVLERRWRLEEVLELFEKVTQRTRRVAEQVVEFLDTQWAEAKMMEASSFGSQTSSRDDSLRQQKAAVTSRRGRMLLDVLYGFSRQHQTSLWDVDNLTTEDNLHFHQHRIQCLVLHLDFIEPLQKLLGKATDLRARTLKRLRALHDFAFLHRDGARFRQECLCSTAPPSVEEKNRTIGVEITESPWVEERRSSIEDSAVLESAATRFFAPAQHLQSSSVSSSTSSVELAVGGPGFSIDVCREMSLVALEVLQFCLEIQVGPCTVSGLMCCAEEEEEEEVIDSGAGDLKLGTNPSVSSTSGSPAGIPLRDPGLRLSADHSSKFDQLLDVWTFSGIEGVFQNFENNKMDPLENAEADVVKSLLSRQSKEKFGRSLLCASKDEDHQRLFSELETFALSLTSLRRENEYLLRFGHAKSIFTALASPNEISRRQVIRPIKRHLKLLAALATDPVGTKPPNPSKVARIHVCVRAANRRAMLEDDLRTVGNWIFSQCDQSKGGRETSGGNGNDRLSQVGRTLAIGCDPRRRLRGSVSSSRRGLKIVRFLRHGLKMKTCPQFGKNVAEWIGGDLGIMRR